jgi:hypothetical protein
MNNNNILQSGFDDHLILELFIEYPPIQFAVPKSWMKNGKFVNNNIDA